MNRENEFNQNNGNGCEERKMLKKLLCLLFCLLLAVPALAENGANTVIEQITYDSGDSIGTVVEPEERPEAAAEAVSAFQNTTLDVVLIIDSSGSMSEESGRGKQLITYAQDAAVYFSQTLFSLNPMSRVGIVQYDHYATEVTQPLEADQQNRLSAAIRGIATNGNTNLADGFDTARNMLNRSSRQDSQRVYVMLTDGLANEGRDPIAAGRDAAADGLVYTIGLLGGMSREYKEEARRVLNAGYENRYFEIDFDDIGDIDAQLSRVFMTIAVSLCAPDDGGCSAFIVTVDSNWDVYATNHTGDYLSSVPSDYKDHACFGYMAMMGNNMDQKTLVLARGKYSIRLRAQTTDVSEYAVVRLQGRGISQQEMLRRRETGNPAKIKILTFNCQEIKEEEQAWEPLDLNAVDPFTGLPARGTEYLASGRLTEETSLRSLPDKSSLLLQRLEKGTHLNVLAVDPVTGWYFVSLIDRDGLLTRGWIPRGSIEPKGYVPNMIWLPPTQFSLPAGTMNRRAPAATAAHASSFAGSIQVTLLHAERDTSGREWVYLRAEGLEKPEGLYVPLDQIGTLPSLAPAGFRIGYAVPAFVFHNAPTANGYTEFMWVAPQTDGSGTVLSGRTSSTSGMLKARGGGRDAMAIRMNASGEYEHLIVTGGAELDSYHCILPEGDHYFVAGVTRSNNKDFKDIWDTQTYSGGFSATTKRANGLVGRLDSDFNIQWLKSFGVGSTPFGFDVVIELADGNLAACGWLNANNKYVLQGNGKQDFLVVKLTKDGTLLNLNCFGGGADDVPDSAVATPDGGLMMVGTSHDNGLIIIIDSNLRQVRRIEYGGSGQDTFDNIRDLGNGTYLVTGFTESGSKGEHDFWAVMIDSEGRMIWSKTYGGSGDEELRGTAILSNNRYLLLGSTLSRDGDVRGGRGVRGSKDAWAVCIDETGRLLWQYTADLPGNDAFNAAAIDPADNAIVMAGLCDNSSDKSADGYVVKIQAP